MIFKNKKQITEIRPFIDDEFYRLQLGPDNIDILDLAAHYCSRGWKSGLDPNRDFSTGAYLEANPDVSMSGINPFFHYLTMGRNEGRMAQPSAVRDPLEAEIALLSAHVDTAYYLHRYPDIAAAGLDPVAHFCTTGWREGRDPHPLFSTHHYLTSNPDVAAAGINPYLHYVTIGKSEGRASLAPMSDAAPEQAPMSDAAPEQAPMSDAAVARNDLETLRPHFDAIYYTARWPDVLDTEIDPLLHYCDFGWKEHRDPSAAFSTRHYLEANPDIAAAGINPFWHYIVAGRYEGRSAQHPGGFKAEALSALQPLEVTVQAWKHKAAPGYLQTTVALKKILLRAVIAGRSRLIVSVGHDHYRKISGGVQLCIQREEELAPDLGAIYLNIHPWQPLPRLAHLEEDPDPIICLIIDGADAGFCRISTLIEVMGQAENMIDQVQVVVHHLMGHLPERIAELVKATGRDECWLWLHDFFTLCPSYALQRNTVSFCGAPTLESDACRLCLYGAERGAHMVRMAKFFDALKVHVIAPSRVTKEFWLSKTTLPAASVDVAPHMKLSWVSRKTPAPHPTDKRIAVGFLGTPAPHKGWPVFEKLVLANMHSEIYRFIFFGTTKSTMIGISQVPVHVTAEAPAAMIDAVAAEAVDLVLHWASWPETFSLSTYEALAGGAYVITNPVSGNVADTVKRLKRGTILDNEAELLAFFADGLAIRLALEARKTRKKYEVHHSLSHMSYTLLQKDAR